MQEVDGQHAVCQDSSSISDETAYAVLRSVAERMMRAQPPGHTLQATAIANEAWIRICEDGELPENRSHLTALATQVIRHALVDHARKKHRLKRGRGWRRVDLDSGIAQREDAKVDVIALDEVLNELAEFGPRQAKIIEMRFFGGLTMQEIADELGVSKRTIESEWAAARGWIQGRLEVRSQPGVGNSPD